MEVEEYLVKHQKRKEENMGLKIIAHRGFSDGYPENTLLAFKKAIKSGADGIETDLRLSLDGEIILFHDNDLSRLTTNDSKVEELTVTDLKKFDLGKGESIPILDELIALAQGKVTLILEIKFYHKTYKQLCDILVERIAGKHDWVEVSCFDDRVLQYLYHLDPNIRLHKLIKDRSVLQEHGLEEKYAYVSYLDIHVSLLKIALELGLMSKYKIILWTVEKEDISEEKTAGIYGIMVNNISKYIKETKVMNE